MQYQELYQEILGLKSPWTVSMVSLDVFRQPVDVYVEYPTVTESCKRGHSNYLRKIECPLCDAPVRRPATTTVFPLYIDSRNSSDSWLSIQPRIAQITRKGNGIDRQWTSLPISLHGSRASAASGELSHGGWPHESLR
jgi:hypothetical protein